MENKKWNGWKEHLQALRSGEKLPKKNQLLLLLLIGILMLVIVIPVERPENESESDSQTVSANDIQDVGAYEEYLERKQPGLFRK